MNKRLKLSVLSAMLGLVTATDLFAQTTTSDDDVVTWNAGPRVPL